MIQLFDSKLQFIQTQNKSHKNNQSKQSRNLGFCCQSNKNVNLSFHKYFQTSMPSRYRQFRKRVVKDYKQTFNISRLYYMAFKIFKKEREKHAKAFHNTGEMLQMMIIQNMRQQKQLQFIRYYEELFKHNKKKQYQLSVVCELVELKKILEKKAMEIENFILFLVEITQNDWNQLEKQLKKSILHLQKDIQATFLEFYSDKRNNIHDQSQSLLTNNNQQDQKYTHDVCKHEATTHHEDNQILQGNKNNRTSFSIYSMSIKEKNTNEFNTFDKKPQKNKNIDIKCEKPKKIINLKPKRLIISLNQSLNSKNQSVESKQNDEPKQERNQIKRKFMSKLSHKMSIQQNIYSKSTDNSYQFLRDPQKDQIKQLFKSKPKAKNKSLLSSHSRLSSNITEKKIIKSQSLIRTSKKSFTNAIYKLYQPKKMKQSEQSHRKGIYQMNQHSLNIKEAINFTHDISEDSCQNSSKSSRHEDSSLSGNHEELFTRPSKLKHKKAKNSFIRAIGEVSLQNNYKKTSFYHENKKKNSYMFRSSGRLDRQSKVRLKKSILMNKFSKQDEQLVYKGRQSKLNHFVDQPHEFIRSDLSINCQQYWKQLSVFRDKYNNGDNGKSALQKQCEILYDCRKAPKKLNNEFQIKMIRQNRQDGHCSMASHMESKLADLMSKVVRSTQKSALQQKDCDNGKISEQ